MSVLNHARLAQLAGAVCAARQLQMPSKIGTSGEILQRNDAKRIVKAK